MPITQNKKNKKQKKAIMNQNGGTFSTTSESIRNTKIHSEEIKNGRIFEIEEEIEEEESQKTQDSNFSQFCKCTSLHGWKYLSSNQIPLKVGWVTVVLASMGVAGFFLGYSCNDFLSSTVQTTQDTSRWVSINPY